VWYDSAGRAAFYVDMEDRGGIEFKQSTRPRGLYYHDPTDATGGQKDAVIMTRTVAERRTKYSDPDYRRAVEAREIHGKIGFPSLREYLRVVSKGQLPDCPIQREDIVAAENIFGPSVPCLKGKTVRRTSPQAPEPSASIPPSILTRYRTISLHADIMYVNNIAFLLTVSKHIHFGAVMALQNKKIENVKGAMREIIGIYRKRGFQVRSAMMDGGFETLRGPLADLQVELNITGRDEHVPKIERYIRTVKERCRAIYSTLPFRDYRQS
jgi:hypothetical protein